MFKIKCGVLTETDCDFVAEGATRDEVKENFYRHGAESPLHKQRYYSTSREEKIAFGKKVDEHIESE